MLSRHVYVVCVWFYIYVSVFVSVSWIQRQDLGIAMHCIAEKHICMTESIRAEEEIKTVAS